MILLKFNHSSGYDTNGFKVFPNEEETQAYMQYAWLYASDYYENLQTAMGDTNLDAMNSPGYKDEFSGSKDAEGYICLGDSCNEVYFSGWKDFRSCFRLLPVSQPEVRVLELMFTEKDGDTCQFGTLPKTPNQV